MSSKQSRGLVDAKWIVFLGLFLLSISNVLGQGGFPAWVGLYDLAHNGWLENENRIGELCSDTSKLNECYLEHLSPLISVHPLYSSPDSSSRWIGDLVVVAVPGKGLSSHFRAAGSQQGTPFTPDLFLQDWGYGTFFHQTISAQSGRWFKLPRGPWAEEVWLHRVSEAEHSSVILVQPGNIIEMRGSSWFVVGADRDVLSLRPEQPADLWCEEGDPPPIVPVEPIRFSRQELLDSNGHLIFRLKYLKGC